MSGGSEANESAIKLARQYHVERGQAGRQPATLVVHGHHHDDGIDRPPGRCGPGAIVAAMVAVESAPEPLVGWLTVSLALLATHVVIWLTLRFSLPLHRVLGESMIRVLTRIFGLLLAAIAVQMMADGVFAYIDSHF